MLIAAICLVAFTLLKFIINLIPAIDFMLPTAGLAIIADIIYGAQYFLPVDFIIGVVAISISLDVAHLVWKMIKTGKGFILGGD
jgi:hypothetical protein